MRSLPRRWLVCAWLAACGGDGGAPSGGAGDGGVDGAARDEDAGGPQPDAGPTGPPFPCPDLYDQDLVPEFEVEISADEWAEMEYAFVNWAELEAIGLDPKEYHPLIEFRYGDDIVTDAMIRLKGNPCCSWWGGKMQFVISFNENDPDARWHGLRKIALDAPPYDPSFLHDRIALAFMRDLGVPAACANSARLNVNGEYYGLYTSIEKSDREMLERLFGDENADGNLYKYGWIKSTNEEDPYAGDRDLWWATYDIPTLETFVNMGEMIQEWAAEAMLPDMDGYWAGSGNFYLYFHPTRGMLFIPWDLDLTFEATPVDADPMLYLTDWGTMPEHREIVLSDPGYFAEYLDALAAALEKYDVPTLTSRLDAWSAQIATAVEEDANKPFTDADHDWAVATMREYFGQRADFVSRWITCQTEGGEDADEDGFSWCTDCNDGDGSAFPGGVEGCDGVDNDCNGLADDAPECFTCDVYSTGTADFAFCTYAGTWWDGEAQCEKLGGALAVPADDAEQTFLVTTAASVVGWNNWWIGVNDQAEEGVWVGPDGTPIDYAGWAPDRPNGWTDQNCVVIDLEAFAGGWNDKSCDEPHPAVCRVP